MPTTAKPPKPITAPSGMSATASSKLAKTLFFGIVPPATTRCRFSLRHTGEGRHPRRARDPAGVDPRAAPRGPVGRDDGSAQLPPLGVAGEEDVGLQEH